MNILIINGPNMNMLCHRPEIYGGKPNETLCQILKKEFDFHLEFFQSNHEGEIIDKIQSAINTHDALVINPAAYTHYSIAIRDALEMFKGIKVEVHLTDINNREDFRKVSVVRDVVDTCFMGEGATSYIKAINYCKERGK